MGGRTKQDPKIGVDYNKARFLFPSLEKEVLVFQRENMHLSTSSLEFTTYDLPLSWKMRKHCCLD